jgi:hypothetical protein
VRGAHWDLSRRVADENSTVFRTYDELFPKATSSGRPDHQRPELFTAYLSTAAKVVPQRASLGFSIDLGVLVPDYEVDGQLWLDHHYRGGYIFRDKLNLDAIPPKTGGDLWRLRYGFDSSTPNRATREAEGSMQDGKLKFRIPIVQKNRPGIDATLIITASDWNA